MIESEKRQWLIDHLRQIAALDDKLANDRLAATGSYSGFDEPGSVKIAREILSELGASV
jgi:hypothetical protein